MNLCVVGTGYVGLVSGACLADSGHRVLCVDIDAAKIEGLQRGVLPIYEPGLQELVVRNHAKARLSFQTQVPDLEDFSAVFLAVGTPDDGDGRPDLTCLMNAAEDVAEKLEGFTVVIIKSTVPPGTADAVRARIAPFIAAKKNVTYSVVSNPEFLKEGDAIRDFQKPSRVVVGVSPQDEAAIGIMRSIYDPFLRDIGLFLTMGNASAELAKYATNGMLATRISFMNEMSRTCEEVGADIDDVRRAIGSDPRIGKAFLFPGPRWGGSCFPKDLAALASLRDRSLLVQAAIDTNDVQMMWFANKVIRDCPPSGHVAIWGAAFKPGTDDTRHSPAVLLMAELRRFGLSYTFYDPQAMRDTSAADMYQCLEGADVLALVTEWPEFKQPDWRRVAAAMHGNIIVDGRNLWNPADVTAAGFVYRGLGRLPTQQQKPAQQRTGEEQVPP